MNSTAPFRCYVVFYYKGNRHRVYNGKPLGKICNPNQQKKMGDRKRELARLCQLVTDALKEGWIPGEPAPGKVVALPADILMVTRIQQAQTRFEVNGWSKPYKRDMNRLASEFTDFLILNHPLAKLSDITPVNLAAFLDAYRSSGRYYMNKRRNLSA